jgi:hypothetical protein
MKLFNKALAGVAVAAALASSAYASPVTVGGVTWDPDDGIDFSAASVAIHQQIDASTGVVSGFGTVNTINGVGGFCAGCELTFQFGGYTPNAPGFLPSIGGAAINYSNGWVKVYVDSTPETALNANANTMTAASTGDGLLWLDLVGHSTGGKTFTGQVNLNSFDSSLESLTGGGLLDAVGGLAYGNFNTNSKSDGSDLSFSNSFTTFLPEGNLLDSLGTGNFKGNTIPEPETLALVGLGLLGLAAARRRKSA